jgi:hypothetical protein
MAKRAQPNPVGRVAVTLKLAVSEYQALCRLSFQSERSGQDLLQEGLRLVMERYSHIDGEETLR